MDLSFLHSESMAMCLAMLILLLVAEFLTRRGTEWKKYIPALYVCTILQLLIDGIWFIIDGKPELIAFHKTIQTAYLIIYPLFGWIWWQYCARLFREVKVLRSRLFDLLLLIPVAVNAILVILSWNNGYVYIVDETGTYIRGPWILFTNGYVYSIMAASVVASLAVMAKTDNPTQRRHLRQQATCTIPTFIMGLAQALTPPGTTEAYFGFVVSFGIIFIENLVEQITQDSMMGLLNRRAHEKKILQAISRAREDDLVFIIMCDLDKFKEVNDVYGHAVGDEALILSGSVLYEVTHRYDCWGCRLHGDEFAILVENRGESAVHSIIREIEIGMANAFHNEDYHMEFTFGTSRYEQGMSLKTLMEKADQDLYENKKRRYGSLENSR